MLINSVSEFRKAIRETRNIYPGGYEYFFLCSDGGELCRPCAMKNFRSIAYAIAESVADGWLVIGSESCANTDGPVICDNCDKILLEAN